MARVNSRKFQRRMAKLANATGTVNTVVMREAAIDIVENIAIELAAIGTSRQVGFDPDLFIANLRATLRQDAQGAWEIDPWEAGGDEDDLDLITDERAMINDRDQTLWHQGKGRTASFFRLIYNNNVARTEMSEARRSVWGDRTPQWYLINYGSPIALQPAEHFIERALSASPIVVIKRSIKRHLQEAWNSG
jgi:hypothetical protein